MAKQSNTEDKLSRLGKIAGGSLTAEDRPFLIGTLMNSNGIVAAKAAQVMAQSGSEDFIPYLEAAFVRFLEHPELDKGCWAKEAISKALDALRSLDPEPFLKGIRHIQMEPVYGGQEDTASGLRGNCAIALARMLYSDVHFELAALLADPELPARLAAVNAVASLGCEKSELLLRMRVLCGDEAPEIVGRCFAGLIAMAPKRSVPFVAGYLGSKNPQIAEQAAIALGESQEESAFEALRDHWLTSTDFDFRRPLLLAIGLTRREEAFRLLLDVITDDGRTSALCALEALDIFASDDRRMKKIHDAVETRKDSKVSEAFAARYG